MDMEKIMFNTLKLFGEPVAGYDCLVLNEREARAGAGILFLFAILSFLYAATYMDFRFTKVFITFFMFDFFMFDFFIRVLVNPKYSPSLIAGRIFISHQSPEYVSAAPKRFAWSIGLVLAVVMFVLVVVLEMMTQIKIAICLLCLTLLYFEAVFGICLGCILYKLITQKATKYCPGGVCTMSKKETIQRVSFFQVSIVLSAFTTAAYFSYLVL